jgi:hypothetical protein
MRRFLPILAAFVLLASCRGDATDELPSPADSGIRGTVTAGPQCPVVQAGSPCPDVPWEGTIDITEGSDVVATVSTFDDGRFAVALDPGTYQVQPVVTGPGTAPPVTVDVPGQGYAEVALTVDTGIR